MPSKFRQWTEANPKKWNIVKAALGLEGLKLMGIDPRNLVP
jgi:hypothetical protein